MLTRLGLGALTAFGLTVGPALAQGVTPDAAAQQRIEDVPGLELLQETGWSFVPLGFRHGLYGWVGVNGDQRQFFYSTPGGEGVVVGLLYGPTGELVTRDQAQAVRDRIPGLEDGEDPVGRQLWEELEASSWVELGLGGGPLVYLVIDPLCEPCVDYWRDLHDPHVLDGKFTVRLILVGLLGEESTAAAARLLGDPAPVAAWIGFAGGFGDPDAAVPEAGRTAVAANTSLVARWELPELPLAAYEDAEKTVQVVLGLPDDIAGLIGAIEAGAGE